MEEHNYKPNSHKYKAAQASNATPEKKAEKVITGKASTKKKGEIQKFADIFVSEDVSNVKNYILLDVLVPAVKKAVSDIVTNGIDMLLYGDKGRNNSRSTVSKIIYNRCYDNANERRAVTSSSKVRTGFDYDDLVFENRGDAEAVISAMDEIIAKYGVVSVGDLYDLAEVTTHNYMIYEYGWTNLRSANVIRLRDGGYMLKMPKAMPID